MSAYIRIDSTLLIYANLAYSLSLDNEKEQKTDVQSCVHDCVPIISKKPPQWTVQFNGVFLCLHLFTKFHENQASSFCIILFTDSTTLKT